MVFRIVVNILMKVAWKLAYIYETTDKVVSFNARARVKGERFLLWTLNDLLPTITFLENESRMGQQISQEILNWIRHLESNYDEEYYQLKPANLIAQDAKKLKKDTLQWFETLLELFSKPDLKLINPENFHTEVKKLQDKVGGQSGTDLYDAFLCLGSGLPTPTVMLLNRVGEYMVRKYYRKVFDKEPDEKATWGTMLTDLKKKLGEDDSLIDLLSHRKSLRNISQHPGQRFEQEDAEQIFFNIRDIINEVSKRLE